MDTGNAKRCRDDRFESPLFITVLCHIHQFVLHRIRGESTKSTRNLRERKRDSRETRLFLSFFFFPAVTFIDRVKE